MPILRCNKCGHVAEAPGEQLGQTLACPHCGNPVPVYDTVLFVQDAACGGSELACNDDFFGLQSSVSVNLTQDQTVMIVVSGFQGNSGNFTLNIN